MTAEEIWQIYAKEVRVTEGGVYDYNSVKSAFLTGFDTAKMGVMEKIKGSSPMRKLFRWHRGGLAESLATVVEVQNFAELENVVRQEEGITYFCDYSSFRTSYCGNDSGRLGEEWKDTYYVLAKPANDKHEYVIGMSNFPKE